MNKQTEINKLLKKGYSLLEAGINNCAFSKEDSLNILYHFEELHVIILGGDVCELTNNYIQPNYDNWYCNRLSNETDIEFSKRSVKKAKDYIMNYNVDQRQIFFSFVLEGYKYPDCPDL